MRQNDRLAIEVTDTREAHGATPSFGILSQRCHSNTVSWGAETK
jgi:hypothetical protein